MFAVRGIAIFLTSFVLLYCALSFLVVLGWRTVALKQASSGRRLANPLFAMRILPLVASTLVTLVFVVPSYLRLEPLSADEETGILPIVFGVGALALLAYGLWRVLSAQMKTSRLIARWLDGADPLEASEEAPAFRPRCDVPPLTLVGVFRPRVLVSNSTIALLSRSEMQTALKHEMAHMRALDNFKKLLFRMCPFPQMEKLETAWSQAAELEADDAAVSSLHEAVDLAAALVKLSRLVPAQAAPECTTGLVSGSIPSRVARLLSWEERAHARQVQTLRWYVVPAALVTFVGICLTYGSALSLTHQLTEWLVR